MKAKEALENLKICFVTPSYLPLVGGTEVAIHEIGKRLVKKGYDLTIITLNHGNFKPYEFTGGIAIYRIAYKSGKINFLTRQLKILKLIKELNKTKKFAVIHQFHFFSLGGASVMAKRSIKKPLITSLMGADTYDPYHPVPKIYNPYMAWIMNNSDVVTSPSNELIHHAKNQGLKKEAIIIPHGVDLDRFNPINYSNEFRNKVGVRDNEIMIFSVQGLHHRKRVEYLINAIPNVIKDYSNVKFVIGGRGPEKENLERLTKRLNIEDNVAFTGFINDKTHPTYYASCDIFVLHSTYEAFGIVLAEAMASGKPVISTSVGAIPEVVDNYKTGIIVPPLDSKALANTILKLVGDKDLRMKMGIEGRRKAEEKYNWDMIVEEYEKIYKSFTFL